MQTTAHLLLLFIVVTDLVVLGVSRLSTCIRAIAWQGFVLGLLPLVLTGSISTHVIFLAAGTIVVKAVVLPRMLRWAMREAKVRREVEPLIGYLGSLLLGVLALGVAFAVATRLPALPGSDLLIPIALASVMIGLVVLITRGKAITQVVGYLILENGVYLFGLTQTSRVPFLIEIGVLLDVFVGAFIMGIVVFHINREFDSISSAQLTELRES
jgi:hydrogenase-4 component E